MLRALWKLLAAGPYYQIIPIIPKLREFVHWFNETALPGHLGIISARIEEAALHRHQQSLKFQHCSMHFWYIKAGPQIVL